ncbi:ISNCY family transposase [Nitrospirillum viridazoti]|uniref:ISNCY family transposase n=1 Tax=Nitrospirillum viridazoti CBAmc TaxID=1441467 RepID=A0A248K2H3_9PROT|nr:ISNCY family transposase [Nitrospirillum amazonense CBAmc]ASG25173.1 ISNCY family transposase [Nitrospirillum amazonense CBAmc]
MGWVVMSERDVRRVEVLSDVVGGRLTVSSAAAVLGLSERQVWRLLGRYRSGGGGAIVHQARGRPSNRQLGAGLRELALELVQRHYADFGPTLAAEQLAERHGLAVSRETLRGWMSAAGLWVSRHQRRQFHRPRLRRERLGELVQIDGSEHRWFEDRAGPCSLLVFIDDATGRLMELRFAASESAFSYFAALEGYVTRHGRPVAFYSDKHTVFRVAKAEARTGQGMTQFGRALAELGIEILCANSSQAKGRVERANRTLQDRLVKELRLAGISDMAAGNAFLPGFMERFNARFAVVPARPEDAHRPLGALAERLGDILCWRERRYVGRQLTLSYERRRVMLEETAVTRGLVGQYVDSYAFADGRVEFRWQGVALPYTEFDKTQRVSPGAVVENKRLSAVLAEIRTMQDTRLAPQVQTNSERIGYAKTGGKPGRKRGSTSLCAGGGRSTAPSAPLPAHPQH